LHLTNLPDVGTGIRPPDKLSVVHYTTSAVLIKHNTATDGHASYYTLTEAEIASLLAALSYLIYMKDQVNCV
jgi:hypothetical protein